MIEGLMLAGGDSGGVTPRPPEMILTAESVPTNTIARLRFPDPGNDLVVDWGDGTIESVFQSTLVSHNYNAFGTFTIKVTGQATRFGGQAGDRQSNCIIGIDNWGDLGFTSFADMSNIFSGANYIEYVPDYLPETVSNCDRMFAGLVNFNDPNVIHWDVSNVTNMTGLFSNASSFNQNIGNWNTKNLQFMNSMFQGAQSFNQDIGNWDTTNAVNMTLMFNNASSFNQDISKWCVVQIRAIPSQIFNGCPIQQQNRPLWNTFLPDFYETEEIEYVGGATSTGTNPVTIPAHQAGDFIVVFTVDMSSTFPSTPGTVAGWNSRGSTTGVRFFTRFAVDSNTPAFQPPSGSTNTAVQVFRNVGQFTDTFFTTGYLTQFTGTPSAGFTFPLNNSFPSCGWSVACGATNNSSISTSRSDLTNNTGLNACRIQNSNQITELLPALSQSIGTSGRVSLFSYRIPAIIRKKD